MDEHDDKQEKRGFKVDDRRRFSESGEARPGQPDAPPRLDAEPDTSAPPGPSPQTPRQQSAPGGEPELELNFSMFVISLSTQALAHLGEIPNPVDNRVSVDLVAAKQMIDILGILREKTKGNLDRTESGLLDNILYDLRLKYVERARSHS